MINKKGEKNNSQAYFCDYLGYISYFFGHLFDLFDLNGHDLY